VRTQKEVQRAGGTHFLSNTEGGTSEDTERKSARGTHQLWSVEGGTSENTERKPASNGYSPTVDRGGRDE
jgi:hypothetical protein